MYNLNRPYFIGLDILRLFAAIAVYIFHLQIHYWKKDVFQLTIDDYLGRLGVSFFFVLSGFLLTYLLFYEHQQTKKINIINFYIRRSTRIWPLYFIVLFIAFYIYPFSLKLITGYQINEKASPVMYFLYLANYDVLRHGLTNSMLGVQWSLAVEEQFYIMLPFLFIIAFSKKHIGVTIALLLIVFSVFYKINVVYYYDTLSVMYNLYAGVLLAILTVRYKKYLELFFYKKSIVVFLFSGFIAYLAYLQIYGYDAINTFNRVCIELIIFCFFIFYFSFNQSVIKTITKSKLLMQIANVGKNYTYSIYLLHMIAITFAQLFLQQLLKINSFIIYALLSSVSLVILCYIAERVIEKPFLKLKQKFY